MIPEETALASVALPSPTLGFKDWSLVCDALGAGRQSLILRKGGIAEGRDGFRFKHPSFFLFPTQFHQQAARVRPDAMTGVSPLSPPPAGTVAVRYFFAVEWALFIEDWSTLQRLEPFHVWREEVVRERFEYEEQRGLQCAFGRVYRIEPEWTFPDRPGFGGCRSWVTLPDFPGSGASMMPVLDDVRFSALAAEVRAGICS